MKTLAFLLFALLLTSSFALAGSATWDTSPTSGDWNTAANWTPETVPDGPADTATFGASDFTNLTFSGQTEVNGIVFEADASAFSIATNLRGNLAIGNGGVTNNSAVVQNFAIDGDSAMRFLDRSTAGANIVFTVAGESRNGGFAGLLQFRDGSSAGDATVVNEAGQGSGSAGSYTQMYNHSTCANATFLVRGGAIPFSYGGGVGFGSNEAPGADAGTATFTIDGGSADGAHGGDIVFACFTHAANATFNINGATAATALPGIVAFGCDATLDNATFIAKGGLNGGPGGSISAINGVVGGGAGIVLSGNATLDISGHDAPGMTIGSLEGHGGSIFLGSNTLSIGSNDRDTTFRGTLVDGGSFGGTGGALTKIGDGRLILAGANRYTGGTHVHKGALIVKYSTGSSTGDGDVNVDGGVLGGSGNIAGAVIVGTGGNRGAILRPDGANFLTIEKSLTFNSDGTCQFAFDSGLETFGEVIALGVTINNALFALSDNGTATLPPGFIIIAIGNTAATPINGTFSNLPDGGTITVGSNTFQANYEGGDGNDLTLTVL